MTEYTAAELLLAQLDHDVAEAKRDVLQEFEAADFPTRPSCSDALEALAERVCLRWWVKRMANEHKEPDKKKGAERAATRAKVLGMCVQRMIERSGPIDPNALQVATLGLSADINAIWGVLIELGMVTSSLRHEYLDASVANTYTRVEDMAQKIVTAGADMRVRQ